MGRFIAIGEYYVEQGRISREELKRLKASFKTEQTENKSFAEYLIENNKINEKELLEYYEDICGIETIDLNSVNISRETSRMIPHAVAQKYGAIPFDRNGETVYVALKDPMNPIAKEHVQKYIRTNIKIYACPPTVLNLTISRLYGGETADRAIEDMERDTEIETNIGMSETFDLEATDEEQNATITYVNNVLRRAVNAGASDIHIQPSESETITRLRVDGILMDIQSAPKSLHQFIVARIKVMSNMNVAERRVPQDGRANIKVDGENYDLRVSSIPAVFGEKIVIRILGKSAVNLEKTAIGLRGDNIRLYDKLLQNSAGVILMVGPTGSGKSSTMATMIKVLNKREVNIMTLEDPVEYNIDGVTQIQINEKVGMTFASGLRAAMRQDPDIICVGEIRDGETAAIAMRAAITGHLVISTVHTNNAVSTFERLKDIGVDSYLIASATLGIVSQRLVRKICPFCKEEYIPDESELISLGYNPEDFKDEVFHRGKGCPMCYGTGYKGRTGVFEILPVTKDLSRAIANDYPIDKLTEIADQTGYRKLKDACMDLVLVGETTLSEMRRIVNSIE